MGTKKTGGRERMGGSPGEVICTPTDPSLEFDTLEMIRLRLAQTLARRDFEEIEAERIALYVVQGAAPVLQFLKVLSRYSPPTDEEVVGALEGVLGEAYALEKAKRLLLRLPLEEVGSEKLAATE